MTSRGIPTTSNHASNIRIKVLILCLVISGSTLLVLILVFALLYLWFVRLSSSKTTPCDSIPAGGAVEPAPLRPFSYRELRVMTDSFNPRNELGRGGSGTVYLGRLRDGKSVAVKKLDASSLQAEREYQNEIQILGNLRSPHLVSLLGYCSDPNRRALVYEFMPNRSLQEALFAEGSPKKIPWTDRYKAVLDIARALAFLHHDCDPPVIHGDIKPSNVLLGADFTAKLSDFGISRVRVEGDMGFEFFSQELWKSQELEKSSALNSEVDFGFALPSVKVDSGARVMDEGCSLKGKGVSTDREFAPSEEDCGTEHSRELTASVARNDLNGQWGRDWWWKQDESEELQSKDYVMEWIGSQIYGSGDHENRDVESGNLGGADAPPEEEAGEVKEVKKGKQRKIKEWWKEEYFAEMNEKSNRLRKFEDKLKRLGSARLWKRHDWVGESSCRFDNVIDGMSFRRSWRRKKNQSRCSEMWSGDLFSRELSSTTSMRGTICYVAPEYGGCGYLMEKGDIYSFGVLVLVVVSGRRPLHISSSPMELQKANLISWARQLAQTGNVLDLVDQNLKNEYNKDQASRCINLALLCLQRAPELRPDSADVVKILNGEADLPTLPVESPPGKSFHKTRKRAMVDAD
ncbi:putative receptor-like protein kinase At1g80870 [Nymphaea colorata]|uniref:non-specific serine/threonine protein kinase n=1 Tax=Nymphaea colorata TaxID=210225 RepID=A0A5K1BXQ2_9MAGN|nr:putative receptor-like protein kinase At1g80870 [Nymphaea colorata]